MSTTPVKRAVKFSDIRKQSIEMATAIVDKLRNIGALELDNDLSIKYGSDGKACLKNKIWLIALWRGGCYHGLQIQGLLDMVGISVDHIAVRTSSYTGVGQQSETVNIHGLSYVTDNYSKGDVIIVVDDVLDSGLTLGELMKKIASEAKDYVQSKLIVAVGFFKPLKNKHIFKDSIHLVIGEVIFNNTWLVFPHEYADLDDEELRMMGGGNELTSSVIVFKHACKE